MRAWCQIRPQPQYRHDAFEKGLKAAGYSLQNTQLTGQPGDVLVIWNRYVARHDLATRFEQQGGTVLVAENAYLDPGRHADRSWYALAVGGHNGQGWTPDGGPERWARIAPQLGAELKPWREGGEHILVCPNRSFGRPGYIMPADWVNRTVEELKKHTKRPIRVRPHPGNDAPRVPLERDLDNCWAVVIWTSSVGVAALRAGIPVICTAPAWICKDAAGTRLDEVESPVTSNEQRITSFQRLAWAQWHVDEIASGEPFRRLCNASAVDQEA